MKARSSDKPLEGPLRITSNWKHDADQDSRCISQVKSIWLTEEPLKVFWLTFSLATLCEKGQVPSVCLHVPRRNLPTNQEFNLKPAFKVLDILWERAQIRSTWCRRLLCQGRGCRGKCHHGYTCRIGYSTCSTAWPFVSSVGPVVL